MNEYNKKFNEYITKNNCSYDYLNSLKSNLRSRENSAYSEETMSQTFTKRKMDKLDDIVHIVIESHHIYAQRDLLTCVKGSKLASVFSQDLTDFEMVRSPTAFKLMLEFLRLNGQINCLHLEADDL